MFTFLYEVATDISMIDKIYVEDYDYTEQIKTKLGKRLTRIYEDSIVKVNLNFPRNVINTVTMNFIKKVDEIQKSEKKMINSSIPSSNRSG